MNCRDRAPQVIGQLRRPPPGCMEHPAHPADGTSRMRVDPGQNKGGRQVGHGKITDDHRPRATVQLHLHGPPEGRNVGRRVNHAESPVRKSTIFATDVEAKRKRHFVRLRYDRAAGLELTAVLRAATVIVDGRAHRFDLEAMERRDQAVAWRSLPSRTGWQSRLRCVGMPTFRVDRARRRRTAGAVSGRGSWQPGARARRPVSMGPRQPRMTPPPRRERSAAGSPPRRRGN